MFQLAVVLGKTVQELESAMTYRELAEWVAFYKLFPFGDVAADWRSAQITAAIAQTVAKKGTKYHAKDFLPFKRSYKPRPRSKEELVERIKAVFGVGNKEEKDKKRNRITRRKKGK